MGKIFLVDEDFSDYIHYTRTHSSSVYSNYGRYNNSGIKNPGIMAKASVIDDGPYYRVYYNVY